MTCRRDLCAIFRRGELKQGFIISTAITYATENIIYMSLSKGLVLGRNKVHNVVDTSLKNINKNEIDTCNPSQTNPFNL